MLCRVAVGKLDENARMLLGEAPQQVGEKTYAVFSGHGLERQ